MRKPSSLFGYHLVSTIVLLLLSIFRNTSFEKENGSESLFYAGVSVDVAIQYNLPLLFFVDETFHGVSCSDSDYDGDGSVGFLF